MYGRCLGLYGHAYGVFKSRALSLLAELQEMGYQSDLPVFAKAYSVDIDTHFFEAGRLLHPRHRWPVLAGLNLSSHLSECHTPGRDDGFGLFYQASSLFPSQRQGRAEIPAHTHSTPAPLVSFPGRSNNHSSPSIHVTTLLSCPFVSSSELILATGAHVLTAGVPPQQPLRAINSTTRWVYKAQEHATEATKLLDIIVSGTIPRPSKQAMMLRALAESVAHRHLWAAISTDAGLHDADWACVMNNMQGLDVAMTSELVGITMSAAQLGLVLHPRLSSPHDSQVEANGAPVLQYCVTKWRALLLWDLSRLSGLGKSNREHPTRGRHGCPALQGSACGSTLPP